jgi:hypothetical protein
MNKKIADKIISETTVARQEIKKRTISYITASFGLIAGLAWNDAIKGLIDFLFPQSSDGLAAKFLYALLLTAAAALLLYYLERIFIANEKKR